jgi:UbiA prenyltransferase family
VGGTATSGLTLATALRLGRVSNLPTVWTNVLAGWVLAGGAPQWPLLGLLTVAMSLFYVAGMFLNDAFDWRFDAAARPTRPIPSGAVSRGTVYATGFVLLAVGFGLLAATGIGAMRSVGVPAGTASNGWPINWRPALDGVALGAAILYYDMRHKRDPLSPFWMGLCRVLVYVGAGAVAVAEPRGRLYAAAAVALCYLVGLTYIAKQETLTRIANLWPLLFLAAPVAYAGASTGAPGARWLALALFLAWGTYALHFLWRRRPGDIPRSVVSLIAGISLLDALFLTLCGQSHLAPLALAAFVLTLALQRYVPGT